MTKKHIEKITEILLTEYPDPIPALKYSTPFELLIAVILSAQCTDERVNRVTEKLFQRASTPEEVSKMTVEELESYIFSCGLYHSKAVHIISASKAIIENFNGEVPSTLEGLRSLDGVGRKTANVVYSVAFHGHAIAVDTHVFRVSNRLGIANGKTPLSVENQLMEVFPEEKWSHLHHSIIFHGRRVCDARKPNCEGCKLNEYCKFYKNKKRG